VSRTSGRVGLYANVGIVRLKHEKARVSERSRKSMVSRLRAGNHEIREIASQSLSVSALSFHRDYYDLNHFLTISIHPSPSPPPQAPTASSSSPEPSFCERSRLRVLGLHGRLSLFLASSDLSQKGQSRTPLHIWRPYDWQAVGHATNSIHQWLCDPTNDSSPLVVWFNVSVTLGDISGRF
jgi:hypothetical protein